MPTPVSSMRLNFGSARKLVAQLACASIFMFQKLLLFAATILAEAPPLNEAPSTGLPALAVGDTRAAKIQSLKVMPSTALESWSQRRLTLLYFWTVLQRFMVSAPAAPPAAERIATNWFSTTNWPSSMVSVRPLNCGGLIAPDCHPVPENCTCGRSR